MLRDRRGALGAGGMAPKPRKKREDAPWKTQRPTSVDDVVAKRRAGKPGAPGAPGGGAKKGGALTVQEVRGGAAGVGTPPACVGP